MDGPGDLDLFQLGGVLHEARMVACYGTWHPPMRPVWPVDFKEYRRLQQAGTSWIEMAIAQVRAIWPFLKSA